MSDAAMVGGCSMIVRIGSLFTGTAGLDLGLEMALADLGYRPRPVWQAERDAYARAVLARHYPAVRRYEDVRDVDELAPPVDFICGGFPCQDLSLAGGRLGLGGERSGLWSEFARVLRVLRPRGTLVENVPGLLAPHQRGDNIEPAALGRVLGDLAELGFDAAWCCVSAADVGAPHLRRRVFILAWRPVAHADGERQLQPAERWQQVGDRLGDGREAPADPMHEGRPWAEDGSYEARTRLIERGWWEAEPNVGRVVDGPASRLDARRRRARLRCLGGGCVPEQARAAVLRMASLAGLGARED
jgi:DNA (cytosine-5)-methyltransferase 1